MKITQFMLHGTDNFPTNTDERLTKYTLLVGEDGVGRKDFLNSISTAAKYISLPDNFNPNLRTHCNTSGNFGFKAELENEKSKTATFCLDFDFDKRRHMHKEFRFTVVNAGRGVIITRTCFGDWRFRTSEKGSESIDLTVPLGEPSIISWLGQYYKRGLVPRTGLVPDDTMKGKALEAFLYRLKMPELDHRYVNMDWKDGAGSWLNRSGDNTLVLLWEDPGAKRHPRIQAQMVKDMIATGQDYVIRTNSETVQTWFQIFLKEGEIDHKDLSFLFFDLEENTYTQIYQITFDKMGNVNGAPPTYRAFFRETTSRLLGLGSDRRFP